MARRTGRKKDWLSPEERQAVRVALLAHVDRIAARTGWMKRGPEGTLIANYPGLAAAAGLSRSGLNGILDGSEPEPRTLVLLARYARESPLLLYVAARWLREDEAGLTQPGRWPQEEQEAQERSLLEEVLVSGEASAHDVLLALELTHRIHARLVERLRALVQQQRAGRPAPPPTQEGSAR